MKTFTICKSLLIVALINGLTLSLCAQSRKPVEPFKKLALPESNFADKVSKLRQYAYATDFSFIEFNDFLPTLQNGQLKLVLPNQKDTLLATQSFVQVKTPKEYSWAGEILARKGEGILGEVLLHYNEGRVSGSIRYKNDAYQIQPLSEGDKVHALYRLDKRYKEGKLCASDHFKPVGSQSVIDKNKGARRDPCTGGNIRVFIYFTSNAQDAGLDVNATVNNCIAEWNAANAVSQTNAPQMELAGSALLPGVTEGNSSQNALDQFTSTSSFPQVQQQRTNARADIMILLCRGENWTDARGRVVDVGPNFNWAYGVIRIGDATNANHTFTHEVGHIFGCRHQTGSALYDAADNTPGPAHGIRLYNLSGQQSNDITVMHVILSANDNRLNRFSKNNLNVNGWYTGGTNANNAQVITSNAGTVQNFQPPANQPITAYISGPSSGNIYCNTYTWEAIYGCGNEGAPVSFEWSVGEDGTNYGNVLSTSETFNQALYTQFMWIRLRVTNNGQVTESYQQVYGNDVGCGGRKAADALVENDLIESEDVILRQPMPNPVDIATELSFYLKQPQQVSLMVVDLSGRPLKILTNQKFEAGNHSYKLNRGTLPSGVYLVSLNTDSAIKTQRIVFR